jgi:acyl carrier protein
MNFLELLNAVAKLARPIHFETVSITEMETPFQEIGIDSLDGLVMMMYLTELYGIEEEVCKEWSPKTPQEMYDLLMAHKTREPASVEEAMEQCK